MKIIEYNTRLDENRLPILAERASYKIDNTIQYTSPEALYNLFCDAVGMDAAPEEYAYCIAFDTKLRIIGLFEISHGNINTSIVSPREIMQKLLYLGAASFVVAHNHPSGDPTPSRQDEAVTKKIKEAGAIMDIPLNDHIIVGNGAYYSFREDMPAIF